jgi:hypothetical protein
MPRNEAEQLHRSMGCFPPLERSLMRCGVHDVGCGICQGRRAARRVEARGYPKWMPEVWEPFDRVSCVAMVSWSEAV